MNRLVAGLLGVSLGIVAAGVSAPTLAQNSGQPTSVINNLGDYTPPSGNGRDGVEVAQGDDGDTITYTIVESPDTYAEPPTAVYPEDPTPPDLSRVPVTSTDNDTTAPPPTGEPVAAPVDPAAQPGGVVGDATTVDPDGQTAAAPAPVSTVATCAGFSGWYDSQIYYESMGGTAAAPDLVASLDPDYDGVACEEIMQPY
jgi:hypothetical protein